MTDSLNTQRILIAGIGSIGGVIAGELIRAGLTPTLVTANAAITDALRTHGLQLHTPEDSVTLSVDAFTTLQQLPPDARFDAVYLTMKANGVQAAARAALPTLSADGYMVSFQNGLVGDLLAQAIGAARVLSVSVAFGSNMEAPGVYRRTSRQNMLYVGERDGRLTPRLQLLAQTLQQVVPVTVSDNITGILWGKLIWNCAVSGLCAITGWTMGELVTTAAGQALFLRIYTEGSDTAQALGVRLEPAVVDYRDFYLHPGQPAATTAQQQQAVAALAIPYSAVKPSIVQSLERGRPTETAFLNGYVVEQAQMVGVSVPVNAGITQMISEIEAGLRPVSPANLDELMTMTSIAGDGPGNDSSKS